MDAWRVNYSYNAGYEKGAAAIAQREIAVDEEGTVVCYERCRCDKAKDKSRGSETRL
jgi:hypothetical protein